MSQPSCTCWEQAFFVEPPDPESGETKVYVTECEGDIVATCATRALAEWLCDMLNMLNEQDLPAISECKGCKATGFGPTRILRIATDESKFAFQLDHEEAMNVLSLIGQNELEYGGLPKHDVALRERLRDALRKEMERSQLAKEASDPDSTTNIISEATAFAVAAAAGHVVGPTLFIRQIEEQIGRDFTKPDIYMLARRIAGNAGATNDKERVEAVVKFARNRSKFFVQRPMENETFAGNGDPDDMAVLIGALLAALQCRISIGLRGDPNRPQLFLDVYRGPSVFARIDLSTLEVEYR